MELLAKTVYDSYLIYRQFIKENGLEDDSDAITADEVVHFVKNNISEDERKEIEELIQEFH